MARAAASIRFREAAGLTAYARNARTHSDDQVLEIAASMREWGWTMPVLISEGCEGAVDGEIIAGHGRVLAAAAIYGAGETIRMASGADIPPGQVPVIMARGWTEAQRRAYVIADNQIGLNAGWDEAILQMELIDLRDVGFDLSKIGFDDAELAGLLDVNLDPQTDPDEAPPLPAEPVSRRGDVWVLGRHRLVCGDATSAAEVAMCIGAGAKPHLMVTDPPYGVDYDPAWRARAGVNLNKAKLGKVANDDRADWREAWALFPGDVVYCWHGALHAAEVAASLVTSGFEIRAQIIWAKDRLVLSRGDYHWQHEPCWYAVRKGKTHQWAGDRSQTTLWSIPAREDEGHGHSTQKPVECMRRPMENNSCPGDGVYDPFVGSGTTIIAAEMTGRRCTALEINPAYVDVVVLRWQAFTGGAATLESDGRSFRAVAAERVPKTAEGPHEAGPLLADA
jgi:DNA modification methylase